MILYIKRLDSVPKSTRASNLLSSEGAVQVVGHLRGVVETTGEEESAVRAIPKRREGVEKIILGPGKDRG